MSDTEIRCPECKRWIVPRDDMTLPTHAAASPTSGSGFTARICKGSSTPGLRPEDDDRNPIP